MDKGTRRFGWYVVVLAHIVTERCDLFPQLQKDNQARSWAQACLHSALEAGGTNYLRARSYGDSSTKPKDPASRALAGNLVLDLGRPGLMLMPPDSPPEDDQRELPNAQAARFLPRLSRSSSLSRIRVCRSRLVVLAWAPRPTANGHLTCCNGQRPTGCTVDCTL